MVAGNARVAPADVQAEMETEEVEEAEKEPTSDKKQLLKLVED